MEHTIYIWAEHCTLAGTVARALDTEAGADYIAFNGTVAYLAEVGAAWISGGTLQGSPAGDFQSKVGKAILAETDLL